MKKFSSAEKEWTVSVGDPAAKEHHTSLSKGTGISLVLSQLAGYRLVWVLALTAALFGLTKSLLSSGFFPAFCGRWRGEPSDLDEAE